MQSCHWVIASLRADGLRHNMLQKAEMKHPLSPGHLNEFWILVNSQQSCKSLQGLRLLRQLSHELLLKRIISHGDGYNSDKSRAGGGNELKSDRADQVKLFCGRQSRSQRVCRNLALQTRATMCRQALLVLSQRPAGLCSATRHEVTNTNKLVRSEAKPVCGTAQRQKCEPYRIWRPQQAQSHKARPINGLPPKMQSGGSGVSFACLQYSG